MAPKTKLRRLLAGKATKGVSLAPAGKRARMTPDVREQIVQALKGGKTARAIANTHGVSISTVNNLKKKEGLTKSGK